MNTKNTIGHTAALFTVVVWGTTFISTKILLDVFRPVEILFYRFVMALIFLFILYPQFLNIREKKRELLFIGAGISGVTLYYLLENIALTYTMASNVAVIVATVPFFTGIIIFYWNNIPHIFKHKRKVKIKLFYWLCFSCNRYIFN